MGGGKGGTSTSTVSIPPEVLARYNAVNARAEDVAKAPFQPYTGQFVAGLTPTQQAGIVNTSMGAGVAQPYYGAAVQNIGQAQNIGSAYAGGAETAYNQAAQMAQPYYQAATEYTLAGSQGIGPGALQTGRYFDPFAQTVAGSTLAALRQQQGQERSQLAARQASTGAFGGDRSGLERSNLARQQELATAQAISPIYSQAYQNALQTAQQQQGVGLSAAQANRAALQATGQQLSGLGQGLFGQGMQLGQAYGGLGQQQFGQGVTAGQQIAGIGTAAQQAALQGAQAQIGAGTLEQQTKQADLTAQYQQFLQQQGYPFQVAQFLANIAMGTGALSGSTTTTQQPSGFFSDRRLKHDVHEIGKTNDGLPIYSFKYNGDDKTQIGLMAQDVEKKHPDAVGVMGGYKTVDYGKATEDSERPERAYGGSASMGGGVWHPDAYAGGGLVDADDMKSILQAQQAGFGPFAGGLYGGSGQGLPGGKATGIVPQASLPVPKLVTAAQSPARQASGLSQAASVGSNIASTGRAAVDFKNWVQGLGKDKAEQAKGVTPAPATTEAAKTGVSQPKTTGAPVEATVDKQSYTQNLPKFGEQATVTPPDATPDLEDYFAQGGVIPRYHKAPGGVLPYKTDQDFEYIPSAILKEGEEEADQAAGQFKKNTSGGGGGGGGGGLGSAIGTAASLASIGKFMLPFFLAEGGVVPSRGHYVDGGPTPTPAPTGVAPSDTPSDTPPDVPSSRKYMDYLTKEKGYDPHVAAGIVGNLYHESGGLNPTILGDKGRSFGLAQFHEAGEQPAFRQWAKENNRDIKDPYAQIDFVHERLQGPYSKTLEAMKNAPDASTAAEHFMRGYERPAAGPTEALPARIFYANTLASGKDLPDNLRGMGKITLGQATQPQASGREMSIGDAVRAITPESFPTSQNFWIPALSGIGAMLASNRPTFLGALGEGMIGGVAGYQQQQKFQAEIAKSVMDAIKERYVPFKDKDGNPKFMDKILNREVMPAEVMRFGAGYAQNFGVDPATLGFVPQTPETPSVPTLGGSKREVIAGEPVKAVPPVVSGAGPQPAAQPAAAQPPAAAPAAGEPKPININKMNAAELRTLASTNPEMIPGLLGDPNNDPRKMQAEINELNAQADANVNLNPAMAAKYKELAQTTQKRLDDYKNQAIEMQYKKNLALQEAATKSTADYREEAIKGLDSAQKADLNIRRLADISADYQTGLLSEAKAKTVQVVRAMGLDRMLPANWQDDPDKYDEAFKLALKQALTSAVQDKLVRAPKFGVETELARFPNPKQSPGAVYALLGETLGEINMSKDQYASYLQKPAGYDHAKHILEFDPKQNKLREYTRNAYASLPANPVISEDALNSLRNTYGDFTPKGRGAATAAPARTEQPSAPAAQPVAPGVRVGEEKQFKQGVGVWNGTQWVPKGGQ